MRYCCVSVFTVHPVRGADGGMERPLAHIVVIEYGITRGSVTGGFGHGLDCVPLHCRSSSSLDGTRGCRASLAASLTYEGGNEV